MTEKQLKVQNELLAKCLVGLMEAIERHGYFDPDTRVGAALEKADHLIDAINNFRELKDMEL